MKIMISLVNLRKIFFLVILPLLITIFLFTILNIYMIIKNKNKLIIACLIVIFCACMYMHITSNRYNKYTNIDEVKIEGIILNKYKESDYNTEYIMKVTNPQKFRNIKIILKTKKNNKKRKESF